MRDAGDRRHRPLDAAQPSRPDSRPGRRHQSPSADSTLAFVTELGLPVGTDQSDQSVDPERGGCRTDDDDHHRRQSATTITFGTGAGQVSTMADSRPRWRPHRRYGAAITINGNITSRRRASTDHDHDRRHGDRAQAFGMHLEPRLPSNQNGGRPTTSRLPRRSRSAAAR